MTEKKATRLSKAAKEFNVGIGTIVEFLHKKGHDVDSNPNSKIEPDVYALLVEEYSTDLNVKKDAEKLTLKAFRERSDADQQEVEQEKEAASDEQELLITDRNAPGDDVKKESQAEEKEKTGEEEPGQDAVPEKADEKIPGKDAESTEKEEEKEQKSESGEGPKVVGKIDLDSMSKKTKPSKAGKKEKEEEKSGEQKDEQTEKKSKTPGKKAETDKPDSVPAEVDDAADEREVKEEEVDDVYKTKYEKLTGPTVVGKIDLPSKKEEKKKKKPVASSSDQETDSKKKRKRIKKDTSRIEFDENGKGKGKKEGKGGKRKRRAARPEVSEEDVQKQIKDTLAKLTTKGSKSKASKYRREKRDTIHQRMIEEEEQQQKDKKVLKVTEFVSVNELASMMDVPANEIIQTCMSLGLMVSINQRLDAETMALLADEFGYTVEFISADVMDVITEEKDEEETLLPRPPIVTVMGHVDHGKTKLLDYVRSANVVAGEAGGITQHIGAYGVELEDKRRITFLDTPGHEAFTAMRARGAQITDVAIIVVAADDGVKPQTIEAINHAAAANVPIVFAINKIDLPTSNPEKIKEELAGMNYLVEDWGGKYQSQEISAKSGLNIEDLLEKVLLEAELLELKANPEKPAVGTVIESTLDRGRGNVATMLVEAGNLKLGDIVLAGQYFGHVKAMFNERGKKIDDVGPSTPVMILGLNGSPQAGDRFNVMKSDRDAKEIANKREQLQREQDLRTKKHITLDEIGRRIAIGNFQELNVIVKGDVDGSVEALSDSLIKLSTDEIQVNIKHKAVGQISESDILLAAASNAIVIGFQVRPSINARRLAEKEQIDIRLYSIIYDAIEEVRAAMEGMLSPEIREEIVATLEVLETFKITKVGTIAGCMVREGKIKRKSKVRLIRDGIVVYTGELGSLKRFKDDAKEVVSGLECGLNIENFNDIKVGDVIEAYEETEVKKKL
ncbi:MAG: translation initiation factor IF-2 [Bacteroidales bacterium]|nr:translation initiation factor IF-2 [Bacteroidales bacterium]